MAAPMLARRLTLSVLKTAKNVNVCRHLIVRPDLYGGDDRPPLMPLDRKARKETVPEDMKSLAQIKKERESQSPDAALNPVNIGLDYRLQKPATVVRSAESRLELEHAARHRTLTVPLSAVRDSWQSELGPTHKRDLADHYSVFDHLFGPRVYFYPVVDLKVTFDFDDDLMTPVYYGNVIPPADAASVPDVSYDADADSLWTLVLTNPDGHLTNQNAEYIHWMVGNIPGSDVSSGEELCSYLQPFPPRGSGFHRHVFVLFKQNKELDFTAFKRPDNCSSLSARTFSTRELYSTFEDDLTPAGLCFFQSEWDTSVKHVYQDVLDMREPAFEYQHEAPYHPPLKMYPGREPFDRYYDRYRDKKDVAEEVVKRRLEVATPYQEARPVLRYPLVHLATASKPTWLKKREELMHRRREQFRHLPK